MIYAAMEAYLHDWIKITKLSGRIRERMIQLRHEY